MPDDLTILAQTTHLRFVRRKNWDYVTRANASGVVCILAVTPENNLLLVEQYRLPVERRVIEFPAGLAGDREGEQHESLALAAQRELWEETGYEAESIEEVFVGPSSAGLTDELITFFIARDLKKTGPGGGDEGEEITLHEVPWPEIDRWLAEQSAEGRLIDVRVPTGLYLLQQHRS